MKEKTTVTCVFGREILDSRGNPTVEVDVILADGSLGRAAVPSGASTGRREAIELRDLDAERFHGKGVLKALNAINKMISDLVVGMDASNQIEIDHAMIKLDGTSSKERLGANSMLGVSLAVARAAANSYRMPLYRYVGGVTARLLPVPMMNIINGGVHADNHIDFQEFMIAPVGAKSFKDATRMGSEIFHTLKRSLQKQGHSTNVGDEGGFAPNFSTADEALQYIVDSINDAGYIPGEEVSIVLDPASSEFFYDGNYNYKGEGVVRSVKEHADYLADLTRRFPIVSIEDPMAEEDYEGWKYIGKLVGDKCQLTGDDVFCTNVDLLQKGIDEGIANSILIKVNQIGTLTEALYAIEVAQKAGYTAVMSHRSGETEDTTISDLAVATNCGQIKTGSLSRSDRTAKYNQLIRLEESLGCQAIYAGNEGVLRNAR